VQDERTGDADTVLVDVTGPAWPQHPNDLRARVDELLAQDFGVAAADDGYLLLRRGVANSTFPDSFYTAWRAPDTETVDSTGLQYGGVLELLGFRVTIDRYGELVAEMTWLPLAQIEQELRFYVAYLAPDGTVLHDNDYYQPVNVLWYPTTLWEPGVPVRVRTLPWALEANQVVPLLGLYTGESWAEGEPLPILSTLTATGSSFPLLQGGRVARLGGYQRDDAGKWQPLTSIAPSPQTVLDVEFGGMIHLTGADLPGQAQAGENFSFALYWKASAPVDFDYTAFAHLLDARGNKVAQLDWQPHDQMGVLPTSAWPQGWSVIDTQTLPLPPDLAPGDYTLLVGFYNWQTGKRLPAQGQGVIGGDAVGLEPLFIEAAGD
jgi:hypothetical protein